MKIWFHIVINAIQNWGNLIENDGVLLLKWSGEDSKKREMGADSWIMKPVIQKSKERVFFTEETTVMSLRW